MRNRYRLVMWILALLLAPSLRGNTRLYLDTLSAPVTRDQLFAIPVYVDTDGQAVVVIDLLLAYPPEALTILGMDTASGAFSTPHFGNPLLVHVDSVNRLAAIVCGVPTPGITGDGLLAGYVIAQSLGTPGIVDLTPEFSTAGPVGKCHLVLDDGQGTDILEGVSGTTIEIGEETSSALFFPHFVEGDDYETTITIINARSDTVVNGVLAVRDDTGDPLAYSLNGARHKGFAVFALQPQQCVRWTTAGEGGLQTGTGLISANQPVGGLILFDSVGGTAGVGAASPASSLLAPVHRSVSAAVDSGVAFYNPAAVARTFTLALRTPDGHVVTEKDFEIPANGQLVRFVGELFPETDTSEFFGSISFAAQFPLTAMVIRAGSENNGSFATMPVISGGETDLYFAQFADGAGIRSTIILLNPSATAGVIGAVFLNDEAGNPLTVDLNGMPVTGSYEFSLPPLGVLALATDGEGDLAAGNVHVNTDGPIGGTILFSGTDGTAGVGHSRPGSSWLVPVELASGRAVNSGLSVINLEAVDIQVQFDLLKPEGQVVAQSPLVTLPAGGQYVRFLTDIFPGYPFPATFQGLIRLDTIHLVAGMALRTGPQSYATLPVVPLE
ncbi:MAG: hypothetical protein JXQ27_02930 [Acidobacteria bacterium]|nr:hypothetical protein [Acidobacteriota bacterium]